MPSRPTSLASLVLLALTLLAPLGAAGVIVVDAEGGGDFVDLQAAIDAASDGDLLLLKGSSTLSYGPFVIDGKSLALHGDDNGSVARVPSGVIRNLSAEQSVALRQVFLFQLSLDDDTLPTLLITDCAGQVSVENCAVFGRTENGLEVEDNLPEPGVRISNSPRVAFTRVTVRGGQGGVGRNTTMQTGAAGIEMLSGTLSLASCTVDGGVGTSPVGGPSTPDDFSPAGDGGPGLLVQEGTVWLLGGTLRGGRGGSGFSYPGFCQPGGDGDVGLRMNAASALLWSRDAAITGGAGGAGGGNQLGIACAPDGQPSAAQDILAGTVAPLSAPMRTYVAPSPLREGVAGTHTFTGEPGDLILLFLSLSPGFTPLVGREGVFHAGFPTLKHTGFLFGTIPANGTREFNLTMPELGPGIDGLLVYLQSALGPLGSLSLSGWSLQLGLDSSF